MGVTNRDLVRLTELHVKELFEELDSNKRCFHNLNHTLEVVKYSKLLGDNYNLSGDNMTVLLVAVWFHDVGYLKDSLDHEQKSAAIAIDFLEQFDCKVEFLQIIQSLIMATKLPSNPSNILEMIICDADLHHLSSHDYSNWAMLLKREVEQHKLVKIPTEDWNKQNYSFLKAHQYFTDYAKSYWEPDKRLNMMELL